MDNEVAVSVICNAYNHEKYIRDALDGFVIQKTSFKFEILIHDDASTDGTADIIREYEEKYPEIIKPIYSKENQYSKGDGSLGRIQYGRVKGKYIAICEGDDYWTDPLKLQKQFDAMEAHPEIDICAHTAYSVVANTKKKTGNFVTQKCDVVIPVEEVIFGGGGYVATCSLFYRAIINKNKPKFSQITGLDYILQIHGALRGGMLYLADNMACYRVMAEGSWTSRYKNSLSAQINHYEKLKKILKQLDEDTNYKYTEVIHKRLLNDEFHILQVKGDYYILKQPPYLDIYKEMPIQKKLKINLKIYFPFLLDIKKKIRKRK